MNAADRGDATATACVTVRAETARAVWRRAATGGAASGGAWMACLVAQRMWTGMRDALQAEYAVVDQLAVVGVEIRRYAGSRHDDSSAGSVEVES